MTDDDFWECPPEQGLAWYGEFRLTLIEPPFPAGGGGALPAHDPERAREFAACLGTVDTVVDEVDRIEATERPPFSTRADLDLVGVGCWGTVTEINDPALVYTGGTLPLVEQADELAARFPGAVLIGSATIDHPMTYGTHVIRHPAGARLFAAGWSGEGDWDLEGTPHEVVDAFGIDPDDLERRGIDLDAAPGSFPWESLTRLVLGHVSPLLRTGRTLSVFRVRHTEEATGDLEDTWMGEPDGFEEF
ncbi:DUF6333 family protein [Streptomyces coeruleoprunus]|uniref:DUF6333 family protein n=1 Tax=Streptomyces coeruleoprunus TaxID=285563 RepID=A0ABV9X9L1_9ACTN